MDNQKSLSRSQRRRINRKKTFKRIINNVARESFPQVKRLIVKNGKQFVPTQLRPLVSSIYKGVSAGIAPDQRRKGATSATTRKVNTSIRDCGDDLVSCLLDPFGYGKEICLPIAPLVPTFKTRIVNNITFYAGTQGVAYLMFAPCLSSNTSIYYSGSSYAGTTYSDDIAATGVNSLSNSSLFNSSQFSTDQGEGTEPLSGRIVVVSMEVIPLASYMLRKGLMRLTISPNRSAIAGLTGTDTAVWHSTNTYNLATMAQPEFAPSLTALAAAPNEITLRPPGGTVDGNVQYPWSMDFQGPTSVGSANVGVFIDGATAGDAFNVRIIQRVEFAGNLVSSYSTIGAINPQAYAQASSLLAELNFQQSSNLH